MKSAIVRVKWKHGLDLRPAALIARVAQRFHSRVILERGGYFSEANSILGLVILCAAFSSTLTTEAEGDDEVEAIRAVAACFESNAPPESGAG
jgi:phosphotransferase system HPr (HPr) family protein